MILLIRMNPREPAAIARRPLRIRVLAKRVAERLVQLLQAVAHVDDGAAQLHSSLNPRALVTLRR